MAHPPPPPPIKTSASASSPFQAAIAHTSNVSSVPSITMEHVRQVYSHAYDIMFQATESATHAAGLNLDALGLSVDNVLTIGMMVAVMSVVWVWRVSSLPKMDEQKKESIPELEEVRRMAPELTPLEKFDVEKEEPTKVRPFKKKYNLTMALESLDPNELILMDKTYKDRINLRKATLKENRTIVRAVNRSKGPDGTAEDPRIRPAVEELYSWIMGHFLPTRYPTMFRLVKTTFESGETVLLHNRVTGDVLPAMMTKAESIEDALEKMNRTVDENMLILLPQDHVPEDQQGSNDVVVPAEDRADGAPGNARYSLEAYFSCFPSGFNPYEKMGKLLVNIHGPVPGYKAKLERSMDKFFSKIEVGKFVKRVNWTLTHRAPLFSLGGTHAAKEEELKGLTLQEIEEGIEETFIRSERQTLYRLPKSKALVFSFHTYVYPLKQVKEEGWGEQIAEAIDGFGSGNVPEIKHYKRVPQWGPAVKEYLRK
ncbi:spermidine resistance protein [Ascosphaera pollenicola]|nr:spermidine resistance protein [Ascosphaera pollenicola]